MPKQYQDGLTGNAALTREQRYGIRHPEKLKQVKASWKQRNRERVLADGRAYYQRPEVKIARRAKRYGLTPEELTALIEAQNNKCALCDKRLARSHVDHCHATGRVRGVVCPRCNITLGMIEGAGFDDWLIRARKYIK